MATAKTEPNKVQENEDVTPSALVDPFSDLENCLGLPALLPDEDIDEFDVLLDHLIRDIKPQGTIEYIYVRDFAVYTFEINRLRRNRNCLVELTEPEAVEKLMSREVSLTFKSAIVDTTWNQLATAATEKVKRSIAEHEPRSSPLRTKSLALVIDDIEKIERMISSAEARRMALVREIDRRHLLLRNRLQDAIQIDDGSFSLTSATVKAPAANRSLS